MHSKRIGLRTATARHESLQEGMRAMVSLFLLRVRWLPTPSTQQKREGAMRRESAGWRLLRVCEFRLHLLVRHR